MSETGRQEGMRGVPPPHSISLNGKTVPRTRGDEPSVSSATRIRAVSSLPARG